MSQEFDGLLEISKELSQDEAIEKVTAGELDLAIIYNEDTEKAEVNVYFNSSSTVNVYYYNFVIVPRLQKLQQPKFSIADHDLAEQSDLTASILSMLIPMLMFSMLASGCMAVAPESIAGEKERGTMATMLITPIKRWQLALGKIISLTCFALLSGISSFIGIIFSLPKLTTGFVGAGAAAIYSVGDYFMLLGLIISIVLVIISAFSVISCLAKSVKESSSLIGPLMILIILLGMVSMFVSGTPSLGLYAIPLVGSGLAISGIMGLTASGLGVALAIISNLVVSALLTVLLGFMFKSEKIMFKK